MNNFDDLFNWWIKRYEWEIKLFFEPKPSDSFYHPSKGIKETILNMLDLPEKFKAHNSEILKVMMSIDFFALFDKLKKHCEPLYEEWERRKNNE